MVPSHEEEVAEGYEFEPPYPFVKVLVGDDPEHLSAYDVSEVYNVSFPFASVVTDNFISSYT